LERELRNPASLERGDGFRRLAKLVPDARFHFNEHERSAIPGDDVQFANTKPIAPGNYCVPAALELRAREIFARFSKLDARTGHGPRSVQTVYRFATCASASPKMPIAV